MSYINQDIAHIFIHIPKCAGSSMELLKWNYGLGHDTLYDFSRKFDISKYFKWCFVRNPYDRIISAYESCPELLEYNMSFDSFIDILHQNKNIVKNRSNMSWSSIPPIGLPVSRIHFFPMAAMLRVNNDINMDFIGKYENLLEDWNYICNRLSVMGSLPHIRKRPIHKMLPHNIKKDIVEKINDIFEEDFATFNYPMLTS